MSIALDGIASRPTTAKTKMRTGKGFVRPMSSEKTEEDPYSLVRCIALLAGFGLIVILSSIIYPVAQ